MTAVRQDEYLTRDRYEALVIGSGFGGAVAACRLAQAGVDVAVAERRRAVAAAGCETRAARPKHRPVAGDDAPRGGRHRAGRALRRDGRR